MSLDQIAEKMLNSQMRLLNMLGIVARNRDRDVRHPCEASAVACQGNDAHIGCSRRFYSADDIWRVAAGADANQDIARPSEGLNLSREYAFETAVIGKGCQEGRIGR